MYEGEVWGVSSQGFGGQNFIDPSDHTFRVDFPDEIGQDVTLVFSSRAALDLNPRCWEC